MYYWECFDSNIGFLLLCFSVTCFMYERQAQVISQNNEFVSNVLLHVLQNPFPLFLLSEKKIINDELCPIYRAVCL